MKKIVIFGSTGMTGVCALEAAVKKGLSVRAFVRDPAKVPDHLKDKVEIIEGNVLEPDSVSEAVEGADGVVIALGTRNNLEATSDMSEGTKNIVEAMRAHNVKPVTACISAFLFYEPEKATSDMSEGTKNIVEAMRAHNVKPVSACISAFLFYEPEKVPPIFVKINEDHKRMYSALKESPLDYVAVFPPHIADEPRRDIIVEVNPDKSPGRSISKWDLGAFLVDALDQPKYYKSVIGIANVPK